MGSDEEIKVKLYSDEEEYLGMVHISFTSPPKYRLANFCSPPEESLTDLPSENAKIWKITFSRSSGIRLVIRCNDVEVVSAVINDTTCTHMQQKWSKEIKKIVFSAADKASDFYKAFPGNFTCVNLCYFFANF